MIMPEFRLLRAFVTLAEELHFGRAASRLNIVQPALSMQIVRLEEAIGVQLLYRTRRTVSLTEPGRLFLEDARRILEQIERSVDFVQRAGRGEAGRLRVGYSIGTAFTGLLSRLLGAFHALSPNVTLDIHEMHPALQRRALLDRELDIGFVADDEASCNPVLDSRVVERWPMVLALPASHPLTRQAVVPLDALRSDPFISYEALGEDLGTDAFRTAAGFSPGTVLRAESPIMLLTLVGAGLGVAIVPHVLIGTAPPGVVFAATDQPFPDVAIVALFRRDNGNATLARFVSDVLAAVHP